jgi:hypothetical protein
MTSPLILNGIGHPALTETQSACCALLREALAEAERGNISSIGIVVCMKGGFASVMAGMQAGDLNLGCDELKAKILEAVRGGNVAKPKQSPIVRARPVG